MVLEPRQTIMLMLAQKIKNTEKKQFLDVVTGNVFFNCSWSEIRYFKAEHYLVFVVVYS